MMLKFSLPLLALLSFSWPVSKIGKSVVPLTIELEDGKAFCTAFSINPNGRYMTAAHCFPPGSGKAYINDDTPVVVTESDSLNDLAVITASVGVQSLKLGSAPESGQKLLMYGDIKYLGFPIWFETLYLGTKKIVSDEPIRFITNVEIPLGMSGGPVVDEKGRLVSVMICGANDNLHMLTCGVDYPEVKKLYTKYGG